MRASVVALAAVTVVSWASWGVLGKLAVDRVDQQVLLWGSVIMMPFIFIGYLAATGELTSLKFDGPGIWWALLGGVGGGVGTVAFYALLSQKRASLVVPLTSLYPAVGVILAVLFLREHVSGSQALGIVFALAAVVLLSR